MRVSTRDIDVIASRLAVKQLLTDGCEVADLNNLVPFSSIYSVGSDIVQRYAQKGPMKFLKEELKRKDPRILFFREADGSSKLRVQLRARYIEIPKELSRLLLSILNARNKYLPMDYLIHNSGQYWFVELKANNARLTKKQIEVSRLILQEGYAVSVLHVLLSIGREATIESSPFTSK